MKKIFLLFIVSLFVFSAYAANAAESVSDLWQGEITFEKTNPTEASRQYCEKADKILRYFFSIPNKTKSYEQKYLTSAKYFYYQAMRIDKSNTDALVGKARIALYENHIRDAKNALSIALNIKENNPKITYYLGETFFKDGEFAKALDFYLHSYNHGYKNNYWTNYKLGVTYEKLDDAQKAKLHYQNALRVNPSSKEAAARLASLDMIKTDYETYRKNIDAKKNKTEPLPPGINDILFGDERMNDANFRSYYLANRPIYLNFLYPFDESDFEDFTELIISPDEREFVIDLDYLFNNEYAPASQSVSESLIIPDISEETEKTRDIQPLEHEKTIKEQLPAPKTFRNTNPASIK